MPLRGPHADLQSISVSCHIYSSRPLLTFHTCLPLLIEELFPYPQLKSCVWFCTYQQGLTKRGDFCLCLERSQARNEHVYVPSTPWERRGDHHVAFLTACVVSHACCSGTPAASRHSHQCSTTVLKNCFGLTVGTDYWGEISHRPPRKKDSDYGLRKGFFVLLSQLPCTSGLSSLAPENSFLFSGVLEVSAPLSFTWSCTWRCWLQVRSLELALYYSV